MIKILNKLSITDYRSIALDKLELDNVIALVGANESGKTNLLRALKYIKPPQNPDDTSDPFCMDYKNEVRMMSPSFKANKYPRLEYELVNLEKLIKDEKLLSVIRENEIKSVIITREGNKPDDYSIELTIKKPLPIIENITTTAVQLIAEQKDTKEIAPQDWIYIESPQDYQTQIDEKVAQSLIKSHDASQAREFLKTKIKNEILSNIKVFFWAYDKDEIIQDIVPIDDFIATPGKYKRVYDLFKIGGWDDARISSFLKNQDSATNINLMNDLSKSVTEIIRKTWHQNQNLNIQIVHAGTSLNIVIKDNDYGTQYAQRSDGLKWFLSFLIGFRAQTDVFKEYVILFDEPGLHLHPGGQKDILDEINRLAEDNQVIYSTHSVFNLDKRFPNRVRLVCKSFDTNNYPLTTIKNSIDETDILKDSLLRSVLGYSITDISPIAEINLLVEGVFDRGLIQLGAKKYYEEFDKGINLNDIAVIACHGAGEIGKTAKHLTSNGLKCLCLYDSDTPGKSARIANTAVATTYKPLLITLITSAIIIEDIYPQTLFQKVYKDFFLEIYPTVQTTLQKNLEVALDKKVQISPGRNKDEIKHEFENNLIDELKKYLTNHTFATDTELTNLKQLVEGLAKLLARLSKYKIRFKKNTYKHKKKQL